MTSAQTATHKRASSGEVLISLALLNLNWEQGRSFVDYFKPFVIDVARALQSPFAAEDVRGEVRASFGIELPTRVVTNILKRLVKDGTMDRKPQRRNDHLYCTKERLRSQQPLRSKSQDARREHEALLHSFVEFAAAHSTPLTLEEAEDSLLKFLEVYGLPLLRSSVGGDELHGLDGSLVASFVVELNARHPTEMAYLVSLVKGNMIRSGVYLDDGAIEQKFRNTTAYLDTPFVLDALGVAGPVQKEAAGEVLQLARSLGVELSCFRPTATEVTNVLTSAAGARRSGRVTAYNSSHVITLSATELDLMAVTLEQKLAALGVRMEARPAYEAEDATVEADLRAAVSKRIAYRNENALEHDIRCLVAIHRLRGGASQSRIESCGAIFLTTNAPLVTAARKAVPPADSVAASLAVVDHEFATLLWLKTPTSAPDLPRRQVIADCYAALNPSDDVWVAYLRQVDRLLESGTIDEITYRAARDGYEARWLVGDFTRGKSTPISSTLGQDVVKALSEKLVEEERRRSDKAKAQLEKRFQLDLDALQTEAERSAAEVEAARTEGEERGRAAAFRTIAHVLAKVVSWAIRVPVMLLVIVALAFGIRAALPGADPLVRNVPFVVALGAFGLLQFCDQVLGIPAKQLVDRLGDSVYRRVCEGIETWLARVDAPNTEGNP